MKSFIPENYQSKLNLYETQSAIGLIKHDFPASLEQALRLKRVSAPLFVDSHSGLNDDLNGVERPVSFRAPATGIEAQVVHSLAKWKRMALYRYDFFPGKGLYTDMNAIRQDEELDNIHSIYVDQWDWEKVILKEERNLDYLKETAQAIVTCICHTLDSLKVRFRQIDTVLKREITVVTTQELEDRWPECSPEEREYRITKEHQTVLLIGIGDRLASGKPHGGRAPDYDDWHLNGDLLFYHPVLDIALEISSMGIRVSPESLDRQLTLAGCDYRRELPFHKLLLEGKLPLTMGGGIGQSRLCMLLLGKAHIGEVQSSLWDPKTIEMCQAANVTLL
ncbi:aspartate--ammonia ligase [Hominifimenecus sp. rT4P-3]|uniref:aspartate--ammonia ligase n=1 Tax=Hominifimenecus sp. rT4P-3 TaxID=3242979 RepID=UPI003DA46722